MFSPAPQAHQIPIALSNSSDGRCRLVATLNCGSAHEPDSWPGLAHLLEHSLFLGSQSDHHSFQAGEIQAQLLQMGGMINASTQFFHTSYMLECPESQLSRAIELLSQLLFCPSFKADDVIGELDIIEAEYQARCGEGEQQVQAVIQLLSSPGHSYHRFCAGNKSTLAHNDPELLCILRRFYQHYYRPENLTLWVEAPEELHGLIENSLPLTLNEHFLQAQSIHAEAILPCDRSIQFELPPLNDPTQTWPESDNLVAIASSQPGYEWCWRLPSLLLPAINQLSLPAGFQHRLRMLDPEQLILSIHYGVEDQLSPEDMQLQLTNLCEQLEFSSHSTTPALQQAVQRGLYHHYKLPIVEGDILSTSLAKQLRRPPRLTLIQCSIKDSTEETLYFPTGYQCNYAFSTPIQVEQTAVVMPYRQLHMTLTQLSEEACVQQLGQTLSVKNTDRYNQSALIWLPAAALGAEDDNRLINKQLCHAYIWQLQQRAYQSLRLDKKLGYIVHLGYQELHQQPGLLLLIQGESRFSGQQLLMALKNFLAMELNHKPSFPPTDQPLWQSYCQCHQINPDLSKLADLNYQAELGLFIYSQ